MANTAVVIGDALIDEIQAEDGSASFVGGAGLNVAVGLARLGVDATFIGTVGADDDGGRIRAFLTDHGVAPLLRTVGERTARAVSVRINGEPSYFFNREAIDRGIRIGAAEQQALDAADVVVVSSFPFDNQAQYSALAAAVARSRQRLVVDPNPRPGLLVDKDLFSRNFRTLAARSLLAKVSDEDAPLLGSADLDTLVRELLDAGAGTVLATAGRNGAFIATAGGARISAPIASLPGTVVDTMGAGDATLSATVRALLDGGVPEGSLAWAELLESAMLVAAATCRSQGALLQIPAAAAL
ncbi:carbohydrate kinase family protein [Pseudarthrobacter sp. P1]|uniref:carbohydrate kinase family protein n=1 Tax=Pseudarthrobacter sp. P1 TaxID=3418418 RepID=UPI003CE87AF0